MMGVGFDVWVFDVEYWTSFLVGVAFIGALDCIILLHLIC